MYKNFGIVRSLYSQAAGKRQASPLLDGQYFLQYFFDAFWINLLFPVSFYIYMVLAITLLSRAEGTEKVLNLTLFDTFRESLQSRVFIVENILLFMPFGIFLGYIKKWKKLGAFTVTVSVCCSASVESIQYLTGRGKFEIDDILTNVLGAALAVLICGFVRILRRRE